MHEQLKKAFAPEGMILGYNSLYFEDPKASALVENFGGVLVQDQRAGLPPLGECVSFELVDLGQDGARVSRRPGGGEDVVSSLAGTD